MNFHIVEVDGPLDAIIRKAGLTTYAKRFAIANDAGVWQRTLRGKIRVFKTRQAADRAIDRFSHRGEIRHTNERSK